MIMTLAEGSVADHAAARALVDALLEGQEDVVFKARGVHSQQRGPEISCVTPRQRDSCQARRESRRSIYLVLKAAEANAEPIFQKLRTAATVKILDSGAFTARAQSDEALKRKREQQDEALKATDSSLVGRLLALRGEGGDMKSRRRDGSGPCCVCGCAAALRGLQKVRAWILSALPRSRGLAILNRLTAAQASGLRTKEIVTNDVDEDVVAEG